MAGENNKLEIDTSEVQKRIVLSGVAVLLLCLAVTLLFSFVFTYDGKLESLTLILLWVGLPLMWLIGSLSAWYKWKKVSYVLSEESLIIKTGSLTKTHEIYYRYDSFLSVEVERSFMLKDSGKIIINIPKLEAPLELNFIKHPHKQAEKLKQRVAANSAASSLVN